jgi:hypothetical protein
VARPGTKQYATANSSLSIALSLPVTMHRCSGGPGCLETLQLLPELVDLPPELLELLSHRHGEQ